MRTFIFALALLAGISGCATVVPLPQWSMSPEASETEYGQYLQGGSATLSGQAFLTQQNGGVVKAAGRTVTLDPATSIGNEWWGKAGKFWVHRALTPPSPGFLKARRTTTADADGKFRFQDLPAGKYYVRTEVTWEIGGYNPTQGGLVGQVVEVKESQNREVILNAYPQ
ncbi:MAG: hypothetical protein M3A44_15135 [Gammaproteobacteria bacterium]